MTQQELMSRVVTDPNVCGGQPCIRGTRIYIAIILDGLAEGLRLRRSLTTTRN
jgi:uncharacterized protein (DUF433 family)